MGSNGTNGSNDKTIDRVVPKEKWEFDGDVTAAFDDMLRRSIPQYSVMRETVLAVGSKIAIRKTAIVDLGASRGEAIAPFISHFGAYNTYHCVEVSPPMLEVLRTRFASYDGSSDPFGKPLIQIHEVDLRDRKKYPPVYASLTLAVLTLMFTPINYRPQILKSIYDWTVRGGGTIIVEKVLGETSTVEDLLTGVYHDYKVARGGYSDEDVERKKLSLEGVLVPLPAEYTERMIRAAGFESVECIWRWMNFAAWVALKR